CVLAPQLLKILSVRSIRFSDAGHRLLLELKAPRSQLANAYAQLPSHLGLGLLAQRRLTNRFKLEFPCQFPARRVFHRTPPQVSILRCPSNVGTFRPATTGHSPSPPNSLRSGHWVSERSLSLP